MENINKHLEETIPIKSEILEYRNKENLRIIGFYDHKEGNPKQNPFVIVPPGYGETKRDSLSMAYHLAMNGFNVIRYDNTYHVGESDGDIIDSTLSKMKEDLLSSINYCVHHFKSKQIGVVASSLSARVAIKCASEDVRIKFLLCLVGIFDFQETLRTVHCEDAVAIILEGKELDYPSHDILGFEVKDEFIKSAINDSYHDLNTTIQDFRQINIPVVLIAAENDVWVKLETVQKVFDTVRSEKKQLCVVPDALHQLQENPEAVQMALGQSVKSCMRYLFDKEVALSDIERPSYRLMAIQNRKEKERLKSLRNISKKDEKQFWDKYLSKFILINKSKDYRSFLKDIYRLLNETNENEILLDAGCGNGHLGAWIIKAVGEEALHNSYHLRLNDKMPFWATYVGLDFAANALREAKLKHEEIQSALIKRLDLKRDTRLLNLEYHLSDLDNKLPFENGYFSKICSNLVISYLKDPLATLKELMRVLRPGGRIVVTSLKPYNDLSIVYRNFLDSAKTDEDIEEARQLLTNAGKIKQKESEGRYQFFTEDQLYSLLSQAGAKDINISRSFANQANVLAATKQ